MCEAQGASNSSVCSLRLRLTAAHSSRLTLGNCFTGINTFCPSFMFLFITTSIYFSSSLPSPFWNFSISVEAKRYHEACDPELWSLAGPNVQGHQMQKLAYFIQGMTHLLFYQWHLHTWQRHQALLSKQPSALCANDSKSGQTRNYTIKQKINKGADWEYPPSPVLSSALHSTSTLITALAWNSKACTAKNWLKTGTRRTKRGQEAGEGLKGGKGRWKIIIL